MQIAKWANLSLRFFLELGILAALGYWGVRTGDGTLAKIALGIGAPLVAAIVWGILLAPRATVHVSSPWHQLLEAIVFGAAIVALYAAGSPTLAVVFLIILVVNSILLYIWRK